MKHPDWCDRRRCTASDYPQDRAAHVSEVLVSKDEAIKVYLAQRPENDPRLVISHDHDAVVVPFELMQGFLVATIKTVMRLNFYEQPEFERRVLDALARVGAWQ